MDKQLTEKIEETKRYIHKCVDIILHNYFDENNYEKVIGAALKEMLKESLGELIVAGLIKKIQIKIKVDQHN